MGRADPGWTMLVFAVGLILLFVLVLVSMTDDGRAAYEEGMRAARRLARGP
ncbi:MAG TPA: hypothetical protein VM889_02865 [Candidatus Thermoplasmatota archaeon]|jgi:hypothetical protein|nr:hypothetical protein [Candidatus Thermoplasmatota archaeon]